jgi:hypothetical protein
MLKQKITQNKAGYKYKIKNETQERVTKSVQKHQIKT